MEQEQQQKPRIKRGDKPAWKGKGEVVIWENDHDQDGQPCEKHLNIQVKCRAFKNWPLT